MLRKFQKFRKAVDVLDEHGATNAIHLGILAIPSLAGFGAFETVFSGNPTSLFILRFDNVPDRGCQAAQSSLDALQRRRFLRFRFLSFTRSDGSKSVLGLLNARR